MVPAVAGLKKQGASNGAAVSFLISTPETGVDSIALTYSLLDPIMTMLRPVAAFVTALAAGVVENICGRSRITQDAGSALPPSLNDCSQPSGTQLGRLGKGLRFAFNDLMNDMAGWFMIGILLAGLITALVPESFFNEYLGSGLAAYLTMLAVALPLYVCASMTTPLAAALVLKGLSPGAALVLLMAGPATNAATVTMVGGLLGRRTLFVYLGSIVVCTLGFAYLTDALYAALGISAQAAAGASAAEVLPFWLEWAAAGVLAVLVARMLWRKYVASLPESVIEPPTTVPPSSECCPAGDPAGCT
ncbi:MAG: permease [Desulfomonile sp.]|nr:permease [Desulfomonile sp.]